MKRTIISLAVLSLAAFATQPASAAPVLAVTADHLGGGLIQYTLQVDNDLGGNLYTVVTASGGPGVINQIQDSLLQDIDTLSAANTADASDAVYQAGGGKAADSWWGDSDYSMLGPPFFGAQGGSVGSNLYQFSGGTLGLPLSSPNLTLLGQIVISDPSAASLPLGACPVITTGIAQLNIINPSAEVTENSVIAADEQNFSIVGTYAVAAILPGDANRDGVVNTADGAIVAANWQTSSGATWAMGDFNDDNAVNDLDATIMATNWLSGAILGDANGDNVVNTADAEVLANYWQTASGATWGMGDFNGDGAVNDLDATIMATNWQTGTNTAVPEPGTLTLLAIACLPLLGLVTRRRKR